MWERKKLIGLVVLLILVVVLILQNTAPVDARVLWFTFTVPQAGLLFGGVLIGFALGVIFRKIWASRRKR